MTAAASGRTDRAERLIHATPETLWQAWADPVSLARWLPPTGMTGQIAALDLRPGGAFDMVLTYTDASAAPGKASADSDRVTARFTTVNAPHALAFDASFPSDDPAFSGTMRMTWRFDATPQGTRVSITADNVPPGISAADHQTGLTASLDHLAAFTQTRP